MELAEKYIHEIYCQRSFSRAAENLFVSQSSLSTTVRKFEKKLGFEIFDRTRSPITLTREGMIYIEYLEEMFDHERNMLRRVQSITHPLSGQITVGGTYFLTRYLLPEACRRFQQVLPDVGIKLHLGESSLYASFFEQLDTGRLQLAIGYRYDESRYTGIPLMKERYVVCVRCDRDDLERLLPYALTYEEILSGQEFPHKVISDYSLFENLRFMKVNSASLIWEDQSKFLSHCQISPCTVYNCRNIDILYDLMQEGIDATITVDTIIASRTKREDILYFLVKTPKTYCQSYVICKADIAQSEDTRTFIRILQETAAERSICK